MLFFKKKQKTETMAKPELISTEAKPVSLPGNPDIVVEKKELLTDKSPLELILEGIALGDTAGMPYEGVRVPDGFAEKCMPLYADTAFFTDDTVLAVATANTMSNVKCKHLKTKPQDDEMSNEEILRCFEDSYVKFAKEFPAGYGPSFIDWVCKHWDPQPHIEPYNSCGNGSAMRVGPVAAFTDTLEACDRMAELSAAVTHNHPEGIKGAVVTAHMAFLALYGATKEDIVAYGVNQYPEALQYIEKPLKDRPMRLSQFRILCQDVMPVVISAFRDTDNFEDCIHEAICYGGDTDTQAAIVGAIAGAYYKSFSEESETEWQKLKQHQLFHHVI